VNNTPVWINRGSSYWFSLEQIDTIEKLKNATWIGAFCLKSSDGSNWNEEPVDVFYVETPEKPEYSNYFGLFYTRSISTFKTDKLYICNAKSIEDQDINALVTPKGEVIYSRYRHDFRSAVTCHVSVDGGRDYGRYVGDFNVCSNATIKVVSGKLLVHGAPLAYVRNE
jgi:hypothetical protein